MMFDKIEKIGKSIVQHGPNNDRVYLMKFHRDDQKIIVDRLYNLTILKRYTKIFAEVPESALNTFKENNFKVEATIPRFYGDEEKGYFLAHYFNAKRSYISRKDRKFIKAIVHTAQESDAPSSELPEDHSIRLLTPGDTIPLANLYKKVFKVYPFPIFDEQYLLRKMDDNVRYFGVFDGNELVAASSAEIDFDSKNAEMTDFATHPNHLGKRLSYFLLKAMEQHLEANSVKTFYTIARAKSHGMNKTFGRSDYDFGGTLVNNTLIGESIESMNVWYKNTPN